jgi:outer membrane protein assembly factor BamE (lipoprotein component of BamABCDE complex)
MKLKFKIIFSVAFLIGSIFIYATFYSNFRQSDKLATKNIEKITLGMDTLQVLDIMGQPIERRNFKGELFFDYDVPSGYSMQCQIIFNPAGKVIFINRVEKRQNKVVNENLGNVRINISELVDSLRGYIVQNLDSERSGVLTIDFQVKNDTSVFIISSIIDKGSIKENPPGYYSLIDDIPVLIFTGVEKTLIFDNLYLSNLYMVTDPFLEEYVEDEKGNIIQLPPNYNPVTWKIEMLSQKIIKTQVLN